MEENKKVGAYQFTDEEVNDLFGKLEPEESGSLKYEQLSLFDDIEVTNEYGVDSVEDATKQLEALYESRGK